MPKQQASHHQGNEAAVRTAVESAGMKGVVVMRPKGWKTRTDTTTVYSSPMYSGYWGGYSPYAYGGYYAPNTPGAIGPTPYMSSPGTTNTYTDTKEVIVVEVLVYSLKQNKLVWAGESQSVEVGKVDEFVTALAALTVKELGEARLIPY